MIRVSNLPLTKIQPDPNQPRKYFDQSKLKELADSIDRHGLLQPILVRPWQNGYQIVHGERRYRAIKLLERQTIEVRVKELTDQEVEDIRLVENIERNDLSPIELAWEFQRRIDNGQTHEQIAGTIGKSVSFVTQRFMLLDLSKRNQHRLLCGELSFSNARLLLQVNNLDLRREISEKIGPDTTVNETRSLIDNCQNTGQSNHRLATRVTMFPIQKLEVYKLIWKTGEKSAPAEDLFDAYMEDLATLRKALREGGHK